MIITVYTPTYNRAFCLHQLYESLLKQTLQDFKWLIVDDGSTDGTKELVKQWTGENRLDISYILQPNRGMLGAHNTAHRHIDTEICVCIDSDDFMPENAVERIVECWRMYGSAMSVAGLVGLDCYKDGRIIGEKFETPGTETTYRQTSMRKGDKKYVYRTDVLREFGPYPEIPGEKFPAQGYLYRLIDSKYKLIPVNEVFCIVEYLPDGNSFNKMGSYIKNPNGFMMHRLLLMKMAETYSEKFRNAVHYVSSCLFAGKAGDIFTNEFRLTTIPAVPLGLILNLYIRRNRKKAVNKKLNK